MLLISMPWAVFASEIEEIAKDIRGSGADPTTPVVRVSSLYSYNGNNSLEFRALADMEGNFFLDISLDHAPTEDSDIVVYYRTVDDSAVAKWGDYESVGALEETFVTLNKSNGYQARVMVRSSVIDYGFAARDDSNRKQADKLVTRRFLFELTRVVGNAELHKSSEASDRNRLYCYLRANIYCDQNMFASPNTGAWSSNMRNAFMQKREELLSYYETDPSWGPMQDVYFRDQTNALWAAGTANIKYNSFYYSTDSASAINTPPITYGGTYTDSVNLKFNEEWYNYVAAGVCDLGISINGRIVSQYWDSDGDATFHLYYNHQGKTKKALTLYLEGEFDDSKFFGWEHAFEYAVEGLTGTDRKDHMVDNFIGFTLYDNDENIAYEVKPHSGSEKDEDQLCADLKKTIIDQYAAVLMAEYNELVEEFNYNENFTAYYLKLPSNFALADSYSYELILEKARESEIRWLEHVKLSFALMSSKEPMIAKDAEGNRMVSTNLDTIKEGDPIRMSVRFDRPVHALNPKNKVYITADIYNDKGVCLAQGVRLDLKQLEGSAYYYAWDTLVFEGNFPEGVAGNKIASLRNIKIVDDETIIKSFFTNYPIRGLTIGTIYFDKDFRTPVATIGAKVTENWTKSKSVDIYVNVKDNNNARFNDYATVYYQWSSSSETPKTYSSKVVFHTKADGEILKTIIGTGNGALYLHLKVVSSYGKSSCSSFGPFKFDNLPPKLSATDITVTGTLKEQTISIPLPDDSGGVGLRDLILYYINKSGEKTALKKFTVEDFVGDPKMLEYTISHKTVGVGVDVNGNVVLDRQAVEFYWVITDKIGNTSEKTAEFTLVFDTNNYLDSEISAVGPYDISSEPDDAQFKSSTTTLDEYKFIYNYKRNNGKTFKAYPETDKSVYYAFSFVIMDNAFGETDVGAYGANVYYKGEKLTNYSVVSVTDGVYVVLFHSQIGSGRYDIQLTRTEGDSVRISQLYSVYATDDEEDDTAIKNKVESGTLLSNTVYQLSSENPYFYYKDANEAIQKVYYNGTKLPPTFSSFAKAKEYVYYKELGDIYLIQLTEAIANALNSGTTGYLIARGESVIPQAGQYWIRYKSAAWTPTSGDSAWVYYYYGMSEELSEDALSANLQAALNTVANRIVGYGKTVILTDTSLLLGTVMGDKMLDEYGMPYLAPEQIHSSDEFSEKTMCGNVWSTQVAFAADKNIYKSTVYVGIEGTADYKEYPIVGRFPLPEGSIFQYMTYEQYKSGTSTWKTLNTENGASFISVLTASGVYYVREISIDGVSIYAIYIDKEAPKVSFSHTDEKGTLKEIPIDGVEINEIRTKDLYIGSIADIEYDRLSYVAVYKVSTLSLVGIYTANDLQLANIKLEDGNYYLVVSDRSGNHYIITAKISSTILECNIKETADRFIRLTCNRKDDQILRYEIYLNGVLVTSKYEADQTFDKAGLYTIYVQDIYGNEFREDYLFERNYPTVTWKYLGADNKYHTYDPKDTNTNGFVLTWLSDNQYKISTSVKLRFSFSGDYGYEFIGAKINSSATQGAETTVTIEAGQSFTLKVYYKSHKDCYTIYSGVVDVTPPSINVSAEVDVLENAEYSLFEDWAQQGNVGDVITMKELYYVLSEISRRTVSNGGTVSSDVIKINASDANALSLIEVYLNGALIEHQDVTSGFSQIVVNQWGNYRIVAKDTLGNVSEFTFTNGKSDYFDYLVDGVKKETELHGYLNFKIEDDKHVYTKLHFGNKDFQLNIKQSADVFMSVGVSGGATEIYGFRISDGKLYPLTYQIVLDKNGNKTIDLVLGEAILDRSAENFKIGQEYLVSKNGAYAVYASVGLDNTVSIKVYVSEDSSKVVSVSARIEDLSGNNTSFVSAELSKKSSNISFKDVGVQTNKDIRVNNGFIIDEEMFESERIASIRLYYSKLNDLDVSKLAGKTNIYTPEREYDDEGFYLLIVRNHYGNESVYRIAISRSFGITSSVTFDDGHRIYYTKDHEEILYSNDEITLDILDEDVTFAVTLNGVAYTGFVQRKEDGMIYLVFSKEGKYEVKLTDSYGNVITRQLEINKSTYTVADELLTGYNEKALKRDEGYTNQKLTIDKGVYDGAGIYYLAIQYGETLNVLYDAFAENPIAVDAQAFINVIGSDGDGVYTVICRNRYGTVVTKDIHYRGTPTLKLERTTRSKAESEIYDLNYALSVGFWSNNTLVFSTEAKVYLFIVNGKMTECPRTFMFEHAGDYGSTEYEITYIDEYGFEYSFKAYLVRREVSVNIPGSIQTVELDGILNTKNNISITFGENIYATYTRNNGEEMIYRSGEVLKKDGTYRFTVMDYAGNITKLTIKKDTIVEFEFYESNTSTPIQNGSVVNSSKIGFKVRNKDSAYIEKVLLNGVLQTDFSGSKFTKDGKWELILRDELGNKGYFCFYIITREQNGFAYTTPYEFRITEMWHDSGDGVKVSYLNFVNHTDFTSSFHFTENGKYTVLMTSVVTGITSTFEFTVNTTAPDVSLVGCNNGETTIKDVTLDGCKVGDIIRIYRATKTGEELVEEIEITSLATKIPTISDGGKYRVVVESEAGVQTELSFVKKHVMNTAGSIFIMVVIGLSVVGLFTGLVYRNKSKTDD